MLFLHKAKATGDQKIPDAEIRIELAFQSIDNLELYDRIFLDDAERLERLLYRCLPGGTYDRLLGKMLERKATHFVVSHQG